MRWGLAFVLLSGAGCGGRDVQPENSGDRTAPPPTAQRPWTAKEVGLRFLLADAGLVVGAGVGAIVGLPLAANCTPGPDCAVVPLLLAGVAGMTLGTAGGVSLYDADHKLDGRYFAAAGGALVGVVSALAVFLATLPLDEVAVALDLSAAATLPATGALLGYWMSDGPTGPGARVGGLRLHAPVVGVVPGDAGAEVGVLLLGGQFW